MIATYRDFFSVLVWDSGEGTTLRRSLGGPAHRAPGPSPARLVQGSCRAEGVFRRSLLPLKQVDALLETLAQGRHDWATRLRGQSIANFMHLCSSPKAGDVVGLRFLLHGPGGQEWTSK